MTVIRATEFVNSLHDEIQTETIEELWMQAKRKLRLQSGTSHTLFPSCLAELNGTTVMFWQLFQTYM